MSFTQLQRNFENITKNVWHSLEDAYNYDISLGETTISDIILLYIKKLNNPKITVRQTKQDEEPKFGTDWLWWIGSNEKGWIAFAIQAKKYHTDHDRYDSLAHKVNKVSQWEILEKYARYIQAVPIYVLYNYVLKDNFVYGINGLISKYSENLFGVTVTPLENIKIALASRGMRNFRFLQTRIDTIPLPELINLTKIFLDEYHSHKVSSILGFAPAVYEEIPKNFESKSKEFIYLISNGLELKVNMYAKRVLIIDIGNSVA